MLKKAGFVAAAATGLTMLGGTAFAAEPEAPSTNELTTANTLADSYEHLVSGSAATTHGVTSLVAGVYPDVAPTPELLMDNLDASDGGSFHGLLPDHALTGENGVPPEDGLLPGDNLLPGNSPVR